MTVEELKKLGLSEEVAQQVISLHTNAFEGYVSQEEVKNSIQKAREEERTKLYDKINSLEEDVKNKDKELSDANEKEKEASKKVDSLQSEIETIKNNMKNGDVDVQSVIDETSKRISNEYEKKLEEERKKTSDRMSQLEQQNNKLSLERYRDKRVSEEGGENALITAMVTGNTQDEIDQSIETAKNEFKKLQERFSSSRNDASDNAANNGGGAPSSPPSIPNGGTPSDGGANQIESTLKGVRNMTTKEYAQKRAEIRSAATKRFGS